MISLVIIVRLVLVWLVKWVIWLSGLKHTEPGLFNEKMRGGVAARSGSMLPAQSQLASWFFKDPFFDAAEVEPPWQQWEDREENSLSKRCYRWAKTANLEWWPGIYSSAHEKGENPRVVLQQISWGLPNGTHSAMTATWCGPRAADMVLIRRPWRHVKSGGVWPGEPWGTSRHGATWCYMSPRTPRSSFMLAESFEWFFQLAMFDSQWQLPLEMVQKNITEVD